MHLREAAAEVVQAYDAHEPLAVVMEELRAALAEPTGKDSLQAEPTVAENATTQQQIEDTPPSDYRRGYWDGFNIGKREGRIEAEDALAEPTVPSDCADSHQSGCDHCNSPLWCGTKCRNCGKVWEWASGTGEKK